MCNAVMGADSASPGRAARVEAARGSWPFGAARAIGDPLLIEADSGIRDDYSSTKKDWEFSQVADWKVEAK